ncbi:MAG: hypothetical protein IT449_10615 [Phycisphaerales bacterium]|nr:hypothetical protein [Phycisphaerales bacterium]
MQTPPGFPAPPCSVDPPTLAGCWTASYTKMGQMTDVSVNIASNCNDPQTRDFHNEFDKLGRTTLSRITSEEWPSGTPSRQFSYSPEWADDGSVTRTGPDGVTTTVTLDDAGRPLIATRGSGAAAISAMYTYTSRGLVDHLDYGNGARVQYAYDDDQRLLWIEHKAAGGGTIMKLGYTYNPRDLPTQIVESDAGGAYATVTFTYDNRGRLIAEARSVSRGTTPAYDLEYVYDQGGNRVAKLDNIANRRVLYTYDISAPTTYGSDNNRLMFYETYDTSGTPWVHLSTTWYSYNAQGNATRIVTESAATPADPVQATRFVYNHSQQVSYIVGEQWYSGNTDCNTYTITYAREFRYDAARARYLNRELDPSLFRQGVFQSVTNGDTWSDYDGDSIYNDFQVTPGTPPTVTNLRSFEPGLAQQDPQGQSTGTKYTHSDRLGTLRTQTDSGGSALATATFTAFGERIDSGAYQRYSYAGAWGYHSHNFPSGEGATPIPFLHVGARYYDPTTGRFLQRDPIGVGGGWNVYLYCEANPVIRIDPSGHFSSVEGSVLVGALTAAEVAELLGYTVATVAVYNIGVAATALCAKAATDVLVGPGQGPPNGPSGKPKRHWPRFPSRSRAEDAAREVGKGNPPIEHPNPTKGPPHFHPARPDGTKVPGPHFEYPKGFIHPLPGPGWEEDMINP